MKLIVEEGQKPNYLVEFKDDHKNHYLHGVFMQSGIKNKNGRIYSPDVMESAVNKYVSEKILNRTSYGELGHPATPTINLDRTAILVESLSREGNDWIGKARIFDQTPMGQIVLGLLDGGANLGVSSRGMGSLKENKGVMEVQPDFILSSAADVVADPSAPSAYVKGIMENVEWIYDEKLGWQANEIIEDQKKFIKENYKQINEQQALNLFAQFLASIS